jgi:hypothetical protein
MPKVIDKEKRQAFEVTINGTDENPWYAFGLTQNPFPQIPVRQLQRAMEQLASLDGEPIKPEGYATEIRKRLEGWSEEFVLLCIQNYKPGQRISFEVYLPEGQTY